MQSQALDMCMASRSKHLSTPDDKAAADREHLTCLVILGYSSEPAISTGSGICQMPSKPPHTSKTMCEHVRTFLTIFHWYKRRVELALNIIHYLLIIFHLNQILLDSTILKFTGLRKNSMF